MIVVYDVSEHSSSAPTETKTPSPVTSSTSTAAPTQPGT